MNGGPDGQSGTRHPRAEKAKTKQFTHLNSGHMSIELNIDIMSGVVEYWRQVRKNR
jgi:hypothetical protein